LPLTLLRSFGVAARPSFPAPLPSFRSFLPPPPSPALFPYTTLFRSHEIQPRQRRFRSPAVTRRRRARGRNRDPVPLRHRLRVTRSEEHTSELQSRENLVCRLLLAKKKPCACAV